MTTQTENAPVLNIEHLTIGTTVESPNYDTFVITAGIEHDNVGNYDYVMMKTYQNVEFRIGVTQLQNETKYYGNLNGLEQGGEKGWSIKERSRKDVQEYANHHMYTDVEPYEVVRKVSDICVEVRLMDTKQTKFPSEFIPGGFSGHFLDNRLGQEYEYISNHENSIVKIRWSEANKQWQKGKHMPFIMSNEPYKFYDNNF